MKALVPVPAVTCLFAALWTAFPLTVHGTGPPELPWKLELSHSGISLSVEEESKLLRAVEARRDFRVTGRTCAVAIIDSGIYAEHTDFTGRVDVQLDFTKMSQGAPTLGAMDGTGHGTAVTGIVAGNRPGPDIGIAPDARILALRVFDDHGISSWRAVAMALKWSSDHAASHHICAINMSLGGQESYALESDARANKDYEDVTKQIDDLYSKSVPVISPSGNRYYKYPHEGMGYPAVLHNVISVGAVSGTVDSNMFRSFADGSTALRTGPNFIAPFSQRLLSTSERFATKIFAPGAYIETASLRGRSEQDHFSGTSDATPLVTGVVVLLAEYYAQHNSTGSRPEVDKVMNWLRAGVRALDDSQGQDSVPHTGKRFWRLDALCSLHAEVASLTGLNTPTTCN